MFARVLLPLLLLASTAAEATERRLHSERVISRTLAAETGDQVRRLQIDNLNGDIIVRAHAAPHVEIEVTQRVLAPTPEDGEQALAEVSLDIAVERDVVDLFVDGPFRDPTDRTQWARRRSQRRYRVVYDFVVLVPAHCDLDLRTITDGEIQVDGVRGTYRLRNVNGGVEARRVDGGGEFSTVNGGVKIDFAVNPRADTEFRTVNGEIDVLFTPDLAADLQLKTSWGEMWSAFDLRPLPSPPPTRRTDGDTFVISTAGGRSFRVADGGPRFSFETLNGDILIRKHD